MVAFAELSVASGSAWLIRPQLMTSNSEQHAIESHERVENVAWIPVRTVTALLTTLRAASTRSKGLQQV